jgi:hypothetical protein
MNGTDQLRQVLETEHGGTATHVQSVPVYESNNGRTVWNGAVQVFDLKDSSSGATRAYASSYGLADGTRRRFAVLHAGSITGPREAVRAAVVAQTGSEGTIRGQQLRPEGPGTY